MRFLCLCPVYNHRQELTENAVQQFLDQTYQDKHLVIMDDRQPEVNRLEPGHDWKQGVSIFSNEYKYPTMGEKYNAMVKQATDAGVEWDAIAIWDDDDLWFPRHLEHHNHCYSLASNPVAWVYPRKVYSTFGHALRTEETGGRFWSSITFTRAAFNAMGGFENDPVVAFDQNNLRKLREVCGDPLPLDQGLYVYMWELTQDDHASGHSSGAACTQWYSKVRVSSSTGPLVPKKTPEAEWVTEAMKAIGGPAAEYAGV